jgi:hypothetical protein
LARLSIGDKNLSTNDNFKTRVSKETFCRAIGLRRFNSNGAAHACQTLGSSFGKGDGTIARKKGRPVWGDPGG